MERNRIDVQVVHRRVIVNELTITVRGRQVRTPILAFDREQASQVMQKFSVKTHRLVISWLSLLLQRLSQLEVRRKHPTNQTANRKA